MLFRTFRALPVRSRFLGLPPKQPVRLHATGGKLPSPSRIHHLNRNSLSSSTLGTCSLNPNCQLQSSLSVRRRPSSRTIMTDVFPDSGVPKREIELRNRAGESKSTYVRSHQDNPVAWQPWNEETMNLAKESNRMIFLSIGYSACHWCHVMERESFATQEVASITNKSFIPIKLDREERPDVDSVYMNFVQATTGSGGWPLNVFLTPELEPVFGGTYWPSPESAAQMPSVMTTMGEEMPVITFVDILNKLRDVWTTEQDRCKQSAKEITRQLREFAEEGTHSTACPPTGCTTTSNACQPVTGQSGGSQGGETVDLDLDLLEQAYRYFSLRYDPVNGGFGKSPKFPTPVNLRFLLQLSQYPNVVSDVVGDQECSQANKMAVHTLVSMTRGGIRDHIGHGFARYSVTADWGLPHFEKMLNDQAQLLDVYVDGFQTSHHPELLGAVYDLVAYLTEEPVYSPQHGCFYTSQDADSLPSRATGEQKHEGAFYTWTYREFVSILGSQDAYICARHWGVSEDGNIPRVHDPADEFLNQNVLSVRVTPSTLAREFGLSEDEVIKIIKRARQALSDHRNEHRVPPDVDENVISGWNGLVIHALAKTSTMLMEADADRAMRCRRTAEKCLAFIKREMFVSSTGQLWRAWRAGTTPDTPGFADDYAYVIKGALSLYLATENHEYLEFAEKLQTYLNTYFLSHDDPSNPAKSTGFYTSPSVFPPGVTPPLIRLKQGTDSALPSANGIISQNLFHLACIKNDDRYTTLARETIAAFEVEILQHPFLYVGLLDGVVCLELGAENVLAIERRR